MDLDRINQYNEEQKRQAEREEELGAVQESGEKVVQAVEGSTKELGDSLNNLLMATIVGKNPEIVEVAQRLVELADQIGQATANVQDTGFLPLAEGLRTLEATLGDIPYQIAEAYRQSDPTPALEEIARQLGEQELSPAITVQAAPVDLSPVEKLIGGVEKAIKGFKVDIPKNDYSALQNEIKSVTKAISSLRFPVPNYVLPYKNVQGAASQVQLDSSGNVPVAGTFSPSGTQDVNVTKVGGTSFSLGQQLAASSLPVVLTAAQLSTLTPLSTVAATQSGAWTVTANAGTNLNTSALALAATQTDKSQFTKLTDGTDTALVTASGEQNVLESNSAAIKTSVELIDNAISGAGFNITQFAGVNNVTGSGTATGALRVELPTNGTGVVNAAQSGTWNVTNVSGTVSLPTGAATSANQTTEITSLQLIDDPIATLGTTTYTEATTKGNIIGVVRRDANTSLVDTTNEIAPLQVNATGELKVAQIQALPAGTNAIGKLAANSGVDIGDVDVLTINGIAPAFGSGARGATVQRVTIATDDSVPVTGTFYQATQPVSYATTGSGTATGTLRVELANNGTGVLATLGTITNVVHVDDNSGSLTVDNAGTFAVQTTPTAPTTIYNGKKTVTTAGTRVTLAASQAVKSVVIKALVANTGVIYVGDGSVASTTGFALQPGDTISLDIANLATVNLDSSVNGEGVTYLGTN